MDSCWQSDVSAFYYAVYVGHSFPSKEQASFNSITAVIISSDFGAQGLCFSGLTAWIKKKTWEELTVRFGGNFSHCGLSASCFVLVTPAYSHYASTFSWIWGKKSQFARGK